MTPRPMPLRERVMHAGTWLAVFAAGIGSATVFVWSAVLAGWIGG